MTIQILRSARYALGVPTAVAMLAGCSSGASQSGLGSSMPIQQNGLRQGLIRLPKAVHSDRGPSWMAPDATKNHLLYISDLGTNDVYVYSYPKGGVKGNTDRLFRAGGRVRRQDGRRFHNELRHVADLRVRTRRH
jgi:hypothetical protein